MSVLKMYSSALTIDVEDGINILMKDYFKIEMPPTDRVERNVEVLLDLFAKNNTRCTFFILGEVAQEYPALLKRINSLGHEIGVHGYHHDKIFNLTPEKASYDISKAKDIIENIIGKQVNGFRAPAFSIVPETSWCLELLAHIGFRYDSSIIPANMSRYGWKGFEKKIIKLNFQENKTLIEAPLPVMNFMFKSIPVCGGGYLRYFPLFFTKWAIYTIRKHQHVIVYLHPYEIDAERYPDYFYDAIASLPLKNRLKLSLYRLNKDTVKNKLSYLLEHFEFKPMLEIINDLEINSNIPVLNF